METKLKVPDFIVLGGHKCGTSSLHYYLSQHPDIFMPYQKGKDILSRINTSVWGEKDISNLEKYKSLFADKKDHQIAGEVSSVYLKQEKVCQTIRDLFDDVKLLMILRNPVDRAWSNFNVKNIANINSNNIDVLNNNKMLAKGKYSEYIKMYYKYFPNQEIKALIFEHMIQNKPDFFPDLFNFLGVDPNFQPNTSVIMRKGGRSKNSSVRKTVVRNKVVKSFLKALLQPFTTAEQRRIISIKAQNSLAKKVNLSPELRQELTNYYRQDILEVQGLIQRDLSHWLK